MEIYLAGGWNGNLSTYWKNRITYNHERSMELYLAGEHTIKNGKLASWENLNILESYFYVKKNKEFPRLIKHCKNFLLDSGAFTFMQGTGVRCDWDRYANEYCDFINAHKIERFFELDIDSIIGIREVEKLRSLIERRTGRKPIPVWHVERGKQYFIDMVQQYDYVALGSIAKVVTGKKKIKHEYFPWFIETAHSKGVKIHALGYTNIEGLKKYRFDSVDSTAWLYGNLTGAVYKFVPQKGKIESIKKTNHRLCTKVAAVNNFNEWVRFMKYARVYL